MVECVYVCTSVEGIVFKIPFYIEFVWCIHRGCKTNKFIVVGHRGTKIEAELDVNSAG